VPLADPRNDRLPCWHVDLAVTPKVRDSDEKIQRGHITKQGSGLVRWAACEAVARNHGGPPIRPAYKRIADRRGKMIARVAAARKLLSLACYGANAKLVLEATLVRDGRPGAIYVREEHRKFGPRRAPLRLGRPVETAVVSSVEYRQTSAESQKSSMLKGSKPRSSMLTKVKC
jgi:hypothetical protein